MGEFAIIPLERVARMFSGGTPSKADPALWRGSVPWLTPKDMGQWNGSTEETVSHEAIGKGTRLAPHGAIFIAVRGMSLHNEIRIVRSDAALTFNQDVKAIVPNDGTDGRFLYYALFAKKQDLLESVEAAGHGTGRLPTDRLRSIGVPNISPAEQSAIASYLGALDDKIELNRRMNETLEAMATAIFKDWFVDFGPTRAKAEGQAPYLAPEIWAIFPDRLDDEGKPYGWESMAVEALAELCKGTINPSVKPDLLFEHYSLPAFDSRQIPAADYGVTIKSNKTPVPEGAVLLSKLNPEISRVWIPNDPREVPQIASTEFLIFRPKAPVGRGTLYCLFRDQGFKQMLEGMVTGTSKSHQRISPPALLKSEALTGSEAALLAFEQIVASLISGMLTNRSDSVTLAQTRDLLLPKLMSGEIRLREAEKIVEAVA
jgi:type I restriction enzyme S subunit